MKTPKENFKSISVYTKDAESFATAVKKAKTTQAKYFSKILAFFSTGGKTIEVERVVEKMPEPLEGQVFVQIPAEYENDLHKIFQIYESLPKKEPGEMYVPIKEEDVQTIVKVAREGNKTSAQTVSELVAQVKPGVYIMMLEGEDNIKAVTKALEKYWKEVGGENGVEESKFMAAMADKYLNEVETINKENK